jgi:hypothetical protein
MTTPIDDGRYQLASELGSWRVVLNGGSELTLAAHGYSKEEGDLVFVVLMEGNPCFEVEVARLRAADVATVEGG